MRGGVGHCEEASVGIAYQIEFLKFVFGADGFDKFAVPVAPRVHGDAPGCSPKPDLPVPR